jgi:hypothetical protein
MMNLNKLLNEILKFDDNYTDGISEYKYGIEFEYTVSADELPETKIQAELLDRLSNYNQGIINDYKTWLEKNHNEYDGNISNYLDLSNIKYFNLAKKFTSELVSNKRYSRYIDSKDTKIVNYKKHVDLAQDFLENDLKQNVISVDDSSQLDSSDYNDNWNVIQEDNNIEISTKILSLNEYDKFVSPVIKWIQKNYPNQSTNTAGLHVHIGIPNDFDIFNALVAVYLMDEKALPSIDRSTEFIKYKATYYDKLQTLVDHIYVNKHISKNEILNVNKNEFMTKYNNWFNKYYGVNILSLFSKNTIEFRYLGIQSMSVLKNWIIYYMNILKKSKELNTFTMHNLKFENINDSLKISYI